MLERFSYAIYELLSQDGSAFHTQGNQTIPYDPKDPLLISYLQNFKRFLASINFEVLIISMILFPMTHLSRSFSHYHSIGKTRSTNAFSNRTRHYSDNLSDPLQDNFTTPSHL